MSAMSTNWQASALAAMSMVIFVATSLTVFAEARIFLVNRLDQHEQFQPILSEEPVYGPSTYSKRLYLDDCLEALTSVRGRTLPPADRTALATSCREEALAISETNPTNGFAFYIAALAGAALDDKEAFNTRLAESRKVSPGEGWLAELRVRLADEKKGLLDPVGEMAFDGDVFTLARSRRRVGLLAQKAVVDKAFRKRVVAVVETLPEADKRAFLNAFRSAMRGRGLN